MAKNCINPTCEKEIPSNATFCLFCGTQQIESEDLSEEEKLHRELNESIKTIELLKKSLTEAHEKINNVSDESIQLLEKELMAEKKKLEANKKKRNSIWVFFLLVSIALGITAIYFYTEYDSQKWKTTNIEEQITNLKDMNSTNDNELQKLKSEQQNLVNEKGELLQKIDNIATYCPIIIKSLKVANVDYNGNIETDYGKTIYASNSMYLKPQIEYIGLKPQTIMLYQKLYQNGVLSIGDSSPSGYSTKYELSFSNDGISGLMSWGNATKGHWSSGNYRYEIWYNNMCLKAVDFRLY